MYQPDLAAYATVTAGGVQLGDREYRIPIPDGIQVDQVVPVVRIDGVMAVVGCACGSACPDGYYLGSNNPGDYATVITPVDGDYADSGVLRVAVTVQTDLAVDVWISDATVTGGTFDPDHAYPDYGVGGIGGDYVPAGAVGRTYELAWYFAFLDGPATIESFTLSYGIRGEGSDPFTQICYTVENSACAEGYYRAVVSGGFIYGTWPSVSVTTSLSIDVTLWGTGTGTIVPVSVDGGLALPGGGFGDPYDWYAPGTALMTAWTPSNRPGSLTGAMWAYTGNVTGACVRGSAIE